MISGIGSNLSVRENSDFPKKSPFFASSLYNLSSYIQSNATLNRAMIDVCGVDIPFIVTANNRDERIERAIRGNMIVFTAFIAPILSMPILNKIFLKKEGLLNHPDERHILQVSKEHLTGDCEKLKEGIKKTAKELENTKKPKFKDCAKHFDNLLKRFPSEELRQKLIRVHKNVFLADFLVASFCTISVPWLSNYITEKRTKRKGYVGEFKIAGENYTDKMAEKHEKLKKTKIGLSYLLPILTGSTIAAGLHRSMKLPEKDLGKIGKLIKKNITLFDYKDAIYMSKMGYFAAMVGGELPACAFACRDKHELKMRATAWAAMSLMLFGGDFVLNNIAGRAIDWKWGTKLMDRKGFEKSGFFKRCLMHVNSFEKLNKMAKLSPATKKAALAMYWGNLALTTILLGFGMSILTNRTMKKDVKKDLQNFNS